MKVPYETELKKQFGERWQTLLKASTKHRVAPPNKEALWNKLLNQFRKGFHCAYCKRALMVRDPNPPYLSVFSIDHKTSFYLGGDNSIDNLEIVCHRCNIIKGAMRHDTFTELLNFCPQSLIDRMFSEIWAGRVADKLGREEALI